MIASALMTRLRARRPDLAPAWRLDATGHLLPPGPLPDVPPAVLRERVANAVEVLIALLDTLDGDANAEPDDDGEPDDTDCCAAGDDHPHATHLHGDWWPGTVEDGEPSPQRPVMR